MGDIIAVVTDATDTRAFECCLPEDEEVASVASQLARAFGWPSSGLDGSPVRYGLVARDGFLLPEHAILSDLKLESPLSLKLVPEVIAGADTKAATSGCGLQKSSTPVRAVDISPSCDCRQTGFDVWMDSDVHREIDNYARRNESAECAGLLLGRVTACDNQRVVHVTAMIPALEAVGSRVSVRITCEAWAAVLGRRDREYSDLRVLGWFHTHSGWGVFMSDTDLFIHRHFFAHPDLVAYVLDTTIGRDAFFRWKNGEVAACPSYGLAYSPASDDYAESTTLGWRRVLRNALLVFFVAATVTAGVIFVDWGRLLGSRADEAPVVNAPQATVENVPDSDMVLVVTAGQTLWEVCEEVYGDGSLAGALARYNGLRSENQLRLGQEIYVPSRETLERQSLR